MIVNYKELMTELLLAKRSETDISLTLNMPEPKFKKYSEKFNDCIRIIYDRYSDRGVLMIHIILSLREYFDMGWLVENVLDKKNVKLMEDESKKEYNIRDLKKRKKLV